MSEVRATLADRDARLSSYHGVAQTTQGADEVSHEFFFRSPNKMRAVMRTAPGFEWSFDGARLYQLLNETKSFTAFELKLPADKAAIFLHSTFAPFVLEGFRAPLMPLKGVTATRVTHPRGPEAVELRLEPGEGVSVTYVLRWPSADFLERRSRTSVGTSALKVTEEHCEEKLKLCVPKGATQYVDEQAVATIRLTAVELNVDLPAEAFSPGAPSGWTSQSRQLVEGGSAAN